MPAVPSPTARALSTLEILQTRPGTTAAELAGRLGVTERAARRYVAILREAGIAVDSVRGPHGGYRLRRGTRLPPVVFTQEEALSLVMAVMDARPATAVSAKAASAAAAAATTADAAVTGARPTTAVSATTANTAAAADAATSEPEDPTHTALTKLLRALPESTRLPAAALREHAAAAPDRLAARADPATVSALVDAVTARRRVRIAYRSEAGRDSEVEVDPWAVVVRHSRWYLLCHSHRADAVRTYRVDRIAAVHQSPHTFDPPPGLDPVATLEEHLGTGWAHPTRVVFDAPLDQVAAWIRPPMGRLERLEAEAGRCVLTGSTRNPQMYAQEWLATIPFPFHVEGGGELRAAVAEVAARFGRAVGRDRDGD
ncbi:MAG: WYL domain-containing protein [Catenulispora sp.]|nr:WYL domain-containing protein [Catenulispora sp.]